jgi:ubiquinone/menaquinone biosynthesis C-methylase UbiE
MGKVERRLQRHTRVGNIDTRVCHFNPGDVVLDAGTGGGYLLKTLSSKCKVVCATDISREFLRGIYDNLRDKDNIYLAQAELSRMPLNRSSFDRVICTEVLEHLADPTAAIAELCRLVTEDGILVVAVPTYFSEKLYSRLNRKYNRNQGQHVTILRRHAWINSFRDAHLEPIAIKNENFAPALYWTLRSIFPIRYDASSGLVTEKRLSDTAFWLLIYGANRLTFGAFDWVGRSIFPKSWYFYLVKKQVAD